jgi:S1-C subfamily serine protease
MQDVARVLFRSVYAMADAEAVTGFRAAGRGETESNRRALESTLAALPPRLGVGWEADAPADPRGVLVKSVQPGSPAARAGLNPGDRIARLGQYATPDGETLRSVSLLLLTEPIDIEVLVAAAEEPETRSITLAGSPSKIGLAWRMDSAEPDSVLVTRVVPGSPAWRAKLLPRDRVFLLNGEPISSSDAVRDALLAAESPLDLTIERRGLIHPLTLDPAVPAGVGESSE